MGLGRQIEGWGITMGQHPPSPAAGRSLSYLTSTTGQSACAITPRTTLPTE